MMGWQKVELTPKTQPKQKIISIAIFFVVDNNVFFFLQAAGLEVVADVLESQCLLIVGKNCQKQEIVDLIVRRIEGYITAEK